MVSQENWRTDGVKVMRAATMDAAVQGQGGRATAFDFTGGMNTPTWVGRATLPPSLQTGPHTHGTQELTVYVLSGRGRIRWGERLEFAADILPGDFVYFPSLVPHEEINLDPALPLEFLVVRSDTERVVNKLDTVPVDTPEMMY